MNLGDGFGDHLKDPMKDEEKKPVTVNMKEEKQVKAEGDLLRQFVEEDKELSNIIGSSQIGQFDQQKQEIHEIGLTLIGKDLEDLLGDTSFVAPTIGETVKTSDTKTESQAAGDRMSIGEMPQDSEYFGKDSHLSSRLDQVSPPRSPFMELDKSSLSEDLAAYPGIQEHHSTSKLIPEKPTESMSPSAPESIYEMFHEGFVNVHSNDYPHATQFGSSGLGVTNSLDDVQPPDFYESRDSSISKDAANKPKSASDSQVLDPDDLDEYLPKDPAESFSTTATISASSDELRNELEHLTAAANEIVENTFAEANSVATTFSENECKPKSDFEMFESTENLESPLKESPSDFCTREIIYKEQPPIQVETLVSLNEQDLLLGQSPTVEVPSPIPPSELENDHLRQIESKHAELTNFLQERDPSSEIDEFDRSEDSISPNPLTTRQKSEQSGIKLEEDNGFDFEKENSNIIIEPTMEATKVEISESGSRAFTSHQTTPFDHVQFGEKESPDSIDDFEFEVIPPKVPPHKYPLGEPSKDVPKKVLETTNDVYNSHLPESQSMRTVPESKPFARDLYEIGEPIGLSPTPPPSAAEKEKQAAEVMAAQKKAEEEFAAFLPKESFEAIPPLDRASETEIIASKIEEPAAKKSEDEQCVPAKPKTTTATSDDIELSEESQQILNILNPKAWFDPNKLHPKVSELVYWRDPKKSGVVFCGIFIILIALTCLSFISVVAYTSLAIVSGTFAFRVYKNILQTVNKTQDGHPFKEYLEFDLTLGSEKTQEICNAIISHLNKLAVQLRHLFLVEDLVDSAKFGGFLYFLTYLGSCFNGLTLVTIAFVALFALPKVYELNKNVIDQYVDLVCAKVSEITAKVNEALPFGKKEKAQ